MKKLEINLQLDQTTLNHLLGGLAQAYRSMPASAPEEVSKNIRWAMIDILDQLKDQGVDILKPNGPFRSYIKLVTYHQVPQMIKNKA